MRWLGLASTRLGLSRQAVTGWEEGRQPKPPPNQAQVSRPSQRCTRPREVSRTRVDFRGDTYLTAGPAGSMAASDARSWRLDGRTGCAPSPGPSRINPERRRLLTLEPALPVRLRARHSSSAE